MKVKITWAIFMFVLIWLACGETGNNNSATKASFDDVSAEDGKKIFKQYCILCHGADGKLGLNGAKDLTVTKLTLKERVALIKSGKNTMTPFEGILTEAEMIAAAKYTMTIGK